MTGISFDALAGAYLRDLLDQPRAVADTIAALAPMPSLLELRDELAAGKRRRIVLTGMGGSYQLLHPACIRLIDAGYDCTMAETSELIYTTPRLLARDSVVVALSQSGASAETVRLLDRPGERPFLVGVTNTEGSPLAARADLTLYMKAGEEAGVSCKTSVASLAVLHWLCEHLRGGDLDRAHADLETLPAAMAAYLARWREHVAALAERVRGVEHVFVVGRGLSLAAAGLGGMIQKEAAHTHGEGMSCAALRHGPFEMLDARCFVVVLEGGPAVSGLNRGLARDVAETGAGAALCGTSGEGPFALPAVPEPLAPVVEMLAPQMLSLALAGLRGREPGKFERITKVTTVE
jgi:glucosamine--fructose-6-phosphate aminotransferase (isomerizing)